MNELREQIARGETFALESTLSGRTYVKFFEEAKDRGYLIELHFVWIPNPQEAIRRVRQRVIEGGHHVPPEDIKRRFARSLRYLVNDYAPLKRPVGAVGQLESPGKTHRKFGNAFYHRS